MAVMRGREASKEFPVSGRNQPIFTSPQAICSRQNSMKILEVKYTKGLGEGLLKLKSGAKTRDRGGESREDETQSGPELSSGEGVLEMHPQ